MNEFMNVTTSTTLSFPANGRGAATAIRGAASTAGATTYTENTAVDSSVVPWNPAGVALGDYAFTADGFWGIVQSFAGAASNSVLTVDRWRKTTNSKLGDRWVPAATNACTVHSSTHTAGSPSVVLKKLILLKGAQTTFSITDQKGTALTNFLFTIVAGQAPGVLADYGDDGIIFSHPIGLICTANTIDVQMVYDASGVGPVH